MSAYETAKTALRNVSARTGAPIPSLLFSFGVLHELTAVVPLVGVFYGARTLGVGEWAVRKVIVESEAGSSSTYTSWARQKCRQWVEEGEGWAERVGRRYGVFGYDKGPVKSKDSEGYRPGHIAGDVANAVVAYGVTKALLPLRIGLSLYLAPSFSRGVVEPVRKGVLGMFRSSK